MTIKHTYMVSLLSQVRSEEKFLFRTNLNIAKLSIEIISEATFILGLYKTDSHKTPHGTKCYSNNINDNDQIKSSSEVYENAVFGGSNIWDRVSIQSHNPKDNIKVTLKPNSDYIIQIDSHGEIADKGYLMNIKWTE